jgi:hypothetical protein
MRTLVFKQNANICILIKLAKIIIITLTPVIRTHFFQSPHVEFDFGVNKAIGLVQQRWVVVLAEVLESIL